MFARNTVDSLAKVGVATKPEWFVRGLSTRPKMITYLDHITVVVRDVEKAKEFFGSISGEKFEKYMGVAVQGPHLSLTL